MSKTEATLLDALTATKGSHSSPGAVGSEKSAKARSLRRLPTLVAPPGAEKTVLPSRASRADIVQYRYVIRSAMAIGGRIVS